MKYFLALFLACLSLSAEAGSGTNGAILQANSIGINPSTDTNFWLFVALPSTYGRTNISHSGFTSYDLFGRMNEVVANAPSSNDTNLIVLLEGGNSIFFGSNSLQAFNSESNRAYAASTNANAFVVEIIPWSRKDLDQTLVSDSSETKSNALVELQAMMDTNHWTFVKGYVRTHTNALLVWYNNLSNFQSDDIHPSAVGATNVIATNVTLGLNAIFQQYAQPTRYAPFHR